MSSPAHSFAHRFRFLLILFSLSGATSLIFETIFTRLLTYTFGNTAYAVSTVFAAFLGGLSIGAFLIGRWVDRRPPSLMIYAALELVVGVYGLFIPRLFEAMTAIYVAIYHAMPPGSVPLTAVRFALAALVMLIPTALMGGSLPALARFVAAASEDFACPLDRLYAANTTGAAIGALASTFVLIPVFGVDGTIAIACLINLLIFVCVVALRRSTTSADESSPRRIPESEAQGAKSEIQPVAVLLVGAFLTGSLALAYEVLWTHLLSFTVGNTVYAFGTMLFAILCGMGWGARIVSRHLARPEKWARALVKSQLGLGLVILLMAPAWDRVSDFFDLGLGKTVFISLGALVLLRITLSAWKNRNAAARLPWLRANEPILETVLFCLLVLGGGSLLKYDATFFVAGEFVRFFCAFSLLIIPALLLGLGFPLLLNLYSDRGSGAGASVGGIYAANTAGAIVGSIVTGFLLLPRLGSLRTMQSLGAMNILLAAAFALFLLDLRKYARLAFTAVPVCVVGLLWILPGSWDLGRLSRGSYVYFGSGYRADKLLYAHEDVQGGLTTVIQIGNERLLLSNGKFQGNDAGAVQAQTRFALIPTLFTRKFTDALVIGLGTGNTLRTIAHFPFEQIDAAELAPSIVDASRQWFEGVNGRVFDRDPRVHLTLADGRNFLLVSRKRYDLITIEITSIWIAGEADLYNREFYRLCRERLNDNGILQQWVQIHHMRTQDLLVILNTVAQEFPHVAFFQGPTQGLIVASASPLESDYRQLVRFDRDPQIRSDLASIGVPSMVSLLGEITVYGSSFDEALSFLPGVKGGNRENVSTDLRPILEYQTPKDNVLPYDTVKPNLEFFQKLRPQPLPPELRIENLDSEDERNLVLGYVLEQREAYGAAIDHFRNVSGVDREIANAEIERIQQRRSEKKSP